MENKAHATAAGAFVVLMLALVIGAVLWFSRDQTVRATYDIVTDQSVNGLSAQANVRLRGINVGRVASVEFLPGNEGKVRIRMDVDQNAPVTNATYATLNYQGVTGMVYVDLSEDMTVDAARRQRLEPKGWGDVPQIPLRSGLLATISDRSRAVLDQAERTVDLLDGWLAQDNMKSTFAAVASLQHAAESIAQASTQLTAATRPALEQLAPALAEARTAMASTRQLADSAQTAVARLGQPGGAADQVAASAENLAAASARLNNVTLPRVDDAMRSIDRAARSVDRLAGTVSDQPQSLIFGPGSGRTPGPGEPGYVAPGTMGGQKP